MEERRSGSISLSVFLVFLMVLCGIFFMSSFYARQALQPDNIKAELDRSGVRDTIAEKYAETHTDMIGVLTSGFVKDALHTDEFDHLLYRYSEYASDYLFTGSNEKKVQDEEITAFISQYIHNQKGDLPIPDELVDSLTTQFVKQANLNRLIPAIGSEDPGIEFEMLFFVLKETTCYVSLALTILFCLCMILSARPSRFGYFAGAGLILTGLLTPKVADAMPKVASFFFDDNQIVTGMVKSYAKTVSAAAGNVLIAGIVIVVLAVILSVVLMLVKRNTGRFSS